MGLLAMTQSSLMSQNMPNFDLNQNNSSLSYKAAQEGIISIKNNAPAQQSFIHGNQSLPGNTFIANLNNVKSLPNSVPGLIVNQPDIDAADQQFDLSQDDLGNLYKLLDYYKTQAGKGKSIILVRQKKNVGNAIDSFIDAKKYVVSDDLSGYTPPTNLATRPSVNNHNNIVSRDNSQSVIISSQNALISNEPGLILNNTDLSESLSLYPNPAQNMVSIDFGQVQVSDIAIFSIQGKLVKTVQSPLNCSTQKIDISDLPSGFYIMNISSPKGIATKKFSKIN